MRSSRVTPSLFVLVALAGTGHFACGGQLENPGGASSGNGSNGGPTGQDDAGVTCSTLGSKATTGPSCDVQASEQCTDGTTYTIDCSCVTATCACSESAANGGGSSGGQPFFCPSGGDCAAYGYAACAFPSTLDAGGGVQGTAPASSCPIAPGDCPPGSYASWFGDGMGNGGGGCAVLPAACQSNATCGCLADAGVTGGCPCTESDGSVAICCN